MLLEIETISITVTRSVLSKVLSPSLYHPSRLKNGKCRWQALGACSKSSVQIRSFTFRVALNAQTGHSESMCNVTKLGMTVCLSQGTECDMPIAHTSNSVGIDVINCAAVPRSCSHPSCMQCLSRGYYFPNRLVISPLPFCAAVSASSLWGERPRHLSCCQPSVPYCF